MYPKTFCICFRLVVCCSKTVYLREHEHLGDFLILEDVIGSELDFFEIDFPLLHFSGQEQLFFSVFELHPRLEVLLARGIPQLDDFVEGLELFERVLKALHHVVLHGLNLLAQRFLPGDHRLVYRGVDVLHAIPLVALDCAVEFFVHVVQVRRNLCDFVESRAYGREVDSQLLGLVDESHESHLPVVQRLAFFDEFVELDCVVFERRGDPALDLSIDVLEVFHFEAALAFEQLLGEVCLQVLIERSVPRFS